MAYTPQNWHDLDLATPLSADRLAHIEAGIQGAAATADAAVPPPPGGTAVGDVPTVQADGSIAYAPSSGGSGGSAVSLTTLKNANYTAVFGNMVAYNISTSRTMTLPTGTALTHGQPVGAYIVQGGDSGTTLTVNTVGSDAFWFSGVNGGSTYKMTGQHEMITFQYDWPNKAFFPIASYRDKASLDLTYSRRVYGGVSWVTATAYLPGAVVKANGLILVCGTAHTSAASIATDIASGYWPLQVPDPAAAQTLPANVAGWLHNDGSGTLVWSTP